jgi:hypothetical protein
MRAEIKRVGKVLMHRCYLLYKEKQNTYLNIIIYSQTFLCYFNPLNAELNPICHLLALLGGATIVVISRLRVKPEQSVLKKVTVLYVFV